MSPAPRRQRIEEQRAKRDRLAYIGTIAAGLVHEVRTPLNAMYLNLQLLEEEVPRLPAGDREVFGKRLGRINTELQAVVKTLDLFLSFARPPRLDTVPTDLNRFLKGVLEFSEPEFAEAGVRIESCLAGDMYPVVLDKAQFTHVMLNLFRNARESIEQKGAGNGCVRVTTREVESWIEILVDDNGAGIEPGREESIFELFYTTKEKGTGLGLGIVRRVVEEHGGEIAAVEPPEGGGARFRIRLPRGKFLEFREGEEEPAPMDKSP